MLHEYQCGHLDHVAVAVRNIEVDELIGSLAARTGNPVFPDIFVNRCRVGDFPDPLGDRLHIAGEKLQPDFKRLNVPLEQPVPLRQAILAEVRHLLPGKVNAPLACMDFGKKAYSGKAYVSASVPDRSIYALLDKADEIMRLRFLHLESALRGEDLQEPVSTAADKISHKRRRLIEEAIVILHP